jgi:DNA (cytosine-5)-methyltransferase 1
MFDFKYTSIDLFSGPGGLTTGLKLCGIKPLIAVEMNAETVDTYASNHVVDILDLEKYLSGEKTYEEIFLPNSKTVLIKGDIRNLSISLIKKILNERFLTEKVDIVSGGPPCESFSIAGKRLQNDHRDFLFVHMSDIAKAVDASLLLFENVKGILSKKKGEGNKSIFQEVCDEFERPDPTAGVSFRIDHWQKSDIVHNCADYGVPQNRERVFLVGINSEHKGAHFRYPKKTHGEGNLFPYVTVKDALEDLPYVKVEEEMDHYELSEAMIDSFSHPSQKEFLKFVRGYKPFGHIKPITNTLDSHRASKHFPKIIKRMSMILPGESMKTAAERLVLEGKEDIRNEYFPKKPYGARYRRLKSNYPSFTVTSHSFDEMIHPTLDRALTPREAARLQTFPDYYVFKGPFVVFHSDPKQDRYEQIGDAVPPIMGYRLGEELVNTLKMIKTEKMV